ncbi:hypothetical protein MBLNU459_g6443t2 [Dothideomycetes sp. NU459]
MRSSTRYETLGASRGLPASLQRLRTAFSPSATTSILSPVSEAGTSSPRTSFSLSRSSMSGRFSNLTSSFSTYSIGLRNSIRRSPSSMELEIEEERLSAPEELISLIEPRPAVGPAVGGIEDMLFGRL